jgi:hypothetical protein
VSRSWVGCDRACCHSLQAGFPVWWLCRPHCCQAGRNRCLAQSSRCCLSHPAGLVSCLLGLCCRTHCCGPLARCGACRVSFCPAAARGAGGC